MLWRVLIGIAIGLIAVWIALLIFLLVVRPRGTRLRDTLRLLPDTVRLLRRLAADRSLPRGVRVRLWLLMGYLAIPIDLVPDFLPVIGYAEDAVIVVFVLRSVVRRAGPAAVRRHWPGSAAGLTTLWQAAGLPGTAEESNRSA